MSFLDRFKLAVRILFGMPLTGEGRTTSKRVAEIASRLLNHPDPDVRTVAASALAQKEVP